MTPRHLHKPISEMALCFNFGYGNHRGGHGRRPQVADDQGHFTQGCPRGADVVDQQHMPTAHGGGPRPRAHESSDTLQSRASPQRSLTRPRSGPDGPSHPDAQPRRHRLGKRARVIHAARQPSERRGRNRHHAPAARRRLQASQHLVAKPMPELAHDRMSGTFLRRTQKSVQGRSVASQAHERHECTPVLACRAPQPLPGRHRRGHGIRPGQRDAASHAPPRVGGDGDGPLHELVGAHAGTAEHGPLEQAKRP